MRLRSSQFVFLLLIACSVQIREEHVSQWVVQATSGTSVRAIAQRETVQTTPPNSSADPLRLAPIDLVSAALATQREPWTMRRPALDSAAVAAYTGLFRA